MTVESILKNRQVAFNKVSMGEVDLESPISENKMHEIESDLKKVGFELIESRVTKIIEDIKRLVREYINEDASDKKLKLSSFITSSVHNDYSYLSDLFSSIEGVTIEQYMINLRIEKVKELLVYDQLSLTEIAYQLGFSSVHHLSAQFKKVTGLTPSHFKKIREEKRKSV
jgi:AraC-like DNA-binding protein